MRTLLITIMLGSTALAGAALAQDAAPTPMVDDAHTTDTAAQMEGGFITWQSQDQMIASNLMGAAMWGAGDEVIGQVDDLLLDRDGQIIGVIVGIGGFLGIGERQVAISTDDLEFVLTQDVMAEGGVAGAPGGTGATDPALAPEADGTMAGGTATSDGTAMPDQTGMGTTTPDATGMTPGTEDNAGAGMGTGTDTALGMNGWGGSVIDHIQVDYTREQLEDAPPFETVE